MDNKRGFTLIELLVAIAIIGILSSMAVVSLSGNKAKARDAIRAGDLKSLSQAVELYYSEHGYVFPDNINIQEIKDYFADGVIPVDPKTGEEYPYAADNSAPKHYCIGAIMEATENNGVVCDGLNLGSDVGYLIKGP